MSARRRSNGLRYFASQRPERSLWLQEALEGERDEPSLHGEERADVCIIGGGYTGLYTALRVKELEPAADIVVVEADICGGGPSGRNGGFMDAWWLKYFALRGLCGSDEALRLGRLASEAIDGIERLCQAHGIDAHIRREGFVGIASNRSQLGTWRTTIDALAGHGISPFEELDANQARELSGSPRALAGIFEAECATVHPARLARGLRRVALAQGVRIYENSPVTAIDRAEPPAVSTAHGRVRADAVVLAMGPWLLQVFELRNAFAAIGTDMVATERMPDRIKEIGRLASGMGMADARMLVNYYRSTVDGRIAWGKSGGGVGFGGRIGERLHGPSPRPAYVVGGLRSLYPELADVRIVSSWTGPVDRSVAGVPFFSRLPGTRSIVYGGGYSGNGVVPSFLGGRILAALALDREDEYSASGIVRPPAGVFPPEPVRYLGAGIVRRAVARRERALDAERRPSAMTTMLSRLAPPGPSESRSFESKP